MTMKSLYEIVIVAVQEGAEAMTKFAEWLMGVRMKSLVVEAVQVEVEAVKRTAGMLMAVRSWLVICEMVCK
jgi:hypothetical protein